MLIESCPFRQSSCRGFQHILKWFRVQCHSDGNERSHRLTTELNIPIQVDRHCGVALHEQLAAQFRRAILDGRLSAGTRLPSTRSLAAATGVSRNVALASYDELFAEGYVEGRHGSGTYVAHDLPATPSRSIPAPSGTPRWLWRLPDLPSAEPDRPGLIDFRLGKPSTSRLPSDAWRRVWQTVASEPVPAGYGDPAGEPLLREAIAAYVRRSRGVVCDASDVVVTSGAVQAVDLVARATLRPGDGVAFENPGYPVARAVLEASGARIVPVGVDDDGLRVDALSGVTPPPLLVYVTPSHQYPLGGRMSLARRMALLEWSREADGLIVEDDYDSEYRYDGPPLPALAGLDEAGRVAYVGTFSKLLAPSLRVGYLVGPAPLRERVVRMKRLADYHTAWPLQRALAAFIADGHLERHVRRMRRHYADKRAALDLALRPVADRAVLRGLEAGLHVFLELDPSLDAEVVRARALERGVAVSTLDGYSCDGPPPNGLLIGYGGLEIPDIISGAATLRECLAR